MWWLNRRETRSKVVSGESLDKRSFNCWLVFPPQEKLADPPRDVEKSQQIRLQKPSARSIELCRVWSTTTGVVKSGCQGSPGRPGGQEAEPYQQEQEHPQPVLRASRQLSLKAPRWLLKAAAFATCCSRCCSFTSGATHTRAQIHTQPNGSKHKQENHRPSLFQTTPFLISHSSTSPLSTLFRLKFVTPDIC